MRLNLGCNHFYADRWINVDLRTHEDVTPDLIHDVREPLPFTPGSIDAVYCGHILEHLTHNECAKALDNIRTVLKPDGLLGVVGPDIELAEAGYPEAIPDIMHGTTGEQGAGHEWVPTLASTVELLEANGWRVTPLTIETMPSHWPVVSRIGWQFALEATPETKPARTARAQENT